MILRALSIISVLAISGCATTARQQTETLRVPYLRSSITVDGRLDEACYRSNTPFTAFQVAADNTRTASATKAWLFWSEEGLVCSFACEDSTRASLPPSANEREVDGQDRAELFLWDGRPDGEYFCVEAAPDGALHDYQARFYRKFDDTWSPSGGWAHKTEITPRGYCVEMVLPRQAIEAMGLKLEPGAHFKMGLFRADYDRLNGQPTWITWIDHGREPDFHVSDSFGTAVLVSQTTRR